MILSERKRIDPWDSDAEDDQEQSCDKSDIHELDSEQVSGRLEEPDCNSKHRNQKTALLRTSTVVQQEQ